MHRTGARMVVAALVLAAVVGCGGGEARKAGFVEAGEAFLAERNYEKARLEFRNALQIDPKDARVQLLAGQAAEKLGEFREALSLYQSVVKAEPGNLVARAQLARLLLFAGARKEAEEQVAEGLKGNAAHPDLLAIRAALKLQASDRDGALRDAEAAFAAEPGNENAAAILASVHAQAGESDAAVKVVERALQATPDSIDLRIVLAQLHLTAGRRPAAEQQLQEVIRRDPTNINQRYRLAQFHVLGRDIDKAEQALRDAAALAPDDTKPKTALANLIATHRSFAAGELSLKDLVAASPKDLPLQLGLGQFYETHRRFESARGVYRAVIDADGTGVHGLAARNRLAALEMQAAQPKAARQLLDEVLAENPRDNDALVMRANLAVSQGDAAAAITDLRAVLRDQPNSQPLLRALAQAYLANEDTTLAEDTLRNAIRGNPRDIQTRLALAQFLIRQNRPDEAQPVVDQLVSDQPDDLPSLEAAFRVQMARRDFAAARRTAESVRATRPDQANGYYLLGLVEQAEEKLAPARIAFEKAVEISPEAVEPLTALMRVDIAEKQPDRAVKRIDAVIARHPKNASIRNLKGEVLIAIQRPAAAVASFSEASKLAPKWWVPYRGAALAELAAGRTEAAVAMYRRGVEASGGAPQLVTDLASLYERMRRPDDAIKLYEDAIRRDAKSDVMTNNLAMLLITYRTDAASTKRALELTERFQNSGNAAFLDTRGWAYFVRGEFNSAVPLLQRAVDLAPRSNLLRARLGLAQFKAGSQDAARDNLERALKEPPKWNGAADAQAALDELRRGG